MASGGAAGPLLPADALEPEHELVVRRARREPVVVLGASRRVVVAGVLVAGVLVASVRAGAEPRPLAHARRRRSRGAVQRAAAVLRAELRVPRERRLRVRRRRRERAATDAAGVAPPRGPPLILPSLRRRRRLFCR